MFSLFTLKMIIVRVGFTFCYFFTHFISFLFLFICLPLWLTSMTQFSSVQLLSRVWLFVTPWIAACQASLSITNSRSLPKLTSVESVMQSSHLSLCRPLLLLPPIPPSIRVFSNESTLRMRWPKYWSFSFNISPLPYLLSLLIFSFICKHTQNIYSLTLFFFINTLNMSFHPACWAPLFLISSQFLIILLTTISVLLLSRFSLWLWLSAIWQCVIVGFLCLYYLGLCYLGFMNIWDLLDSIFHQIWQVLDITSSSFFFLFLFLSPSWDTARRQETGDSWDSWLECVILSLPYSSVCFLLLKLGIFYWSNSCSQWFLIPPTQICSWFPHSICCNNWL